MKVTVFSRTADADNHNFVWEKTVYDNAVVTAVNGGISDGSVSMQNTGMTVRLFGGNISVPSVGDMIVSGEAESISPPESASVIESVSDNRRGSSRVSHIKIVAQ